MDIVSPTLLLYKALQDLPDNDFQTFKRFLRNESRPIPVRRLVCANRMKIVDEVVNVYGPNAVEISVRILQRMHRYDLIVNLTEVNSKDEVKTTVCHIQMKNTATNGGIVFNPNISDCRNNTFNINVISQVPVDRHMAEQSYLQTFVPPPEHPLRVFPSQVCTLLNLQCGHVDSDDLLMLSLMEQWKKLEPGKKSEITFEFHRMIREARFNSHTS